MNQAALDLYPGLIAFLSGVGLMLLCFRALWGRRAPDAVEHDALPSPAKSITDSSSAETAAQQLRDAALNMVDDVNAHDSMMGETSLKLSSPIGSDDDPAECIVESVSELLQANATLQTQRESAEERIQRQADEIQSQQYAAETDPLTGLYNRRRFTAAMQESLEQLQRYAQPFSLLMFDVDHFKRLNDAHGYLTGDEVLRAIGRVLPQLFKSTDVACRYGGEEFAVVLRGANIIEAQPISERLRTALEAFTIQAAGRTITITASVGVAEAAAGEPLHNVVWRADDCVFASKQAGGNCSHWHNGSKCLSIKPSARGVRAGRRPAATTGAGGWAAKPVLPPRPLPGREAILKRLEQAVNQKPTLSPLTVMHLQVCRFAAIAADHGAETAKRVETLVAEAASQSLRARDLMGLWAPGELVGVLPECAEPAAKIVVRRVLAAAPASIRLTDGERLAVELTAGIAVCQNGDTAEDLIERAQRDGEALTEQSDLLPGIRLPI